MSQSVQQSLIQPAVALKPRHLDLIARKAVLNGYMTRARKLIEKIDEMLNPVIDLELKAANDSKTVVRIQAKAVEVQRFSRETIRYKEICEKVLDKGLIQKILTETENGQPVYKAEVITRRAKILGPVNI